MIPIPIDILKKYAGKPIVSKAYDGDPENDYYVGDFIDPGMFSHVFAEVDSSESYFTTNGYEFFNESFLPEIIPLLLKEEKDIFVREGERIKDPLVLFEEFKNISPLYGSEAIQKAPYSIVFSNIPRNEIREGIRKFYGNSIDQYLDTILRHNKNVLLLKTLNKTFEALGYTTLRGYRYRIILKDYWFWINLNKRAFWNEFHPFISMAPIIDESRKYRDAYHERHEKTKMYKCLPTAKIGKPDSLIDEQEFNNFHNSIKQLLSNLAVNKRTEEDLLIYLDKKFESISLKEREEPPFGTGDCQ